jgi:hypothetical protein
MRAEFNSGGCSAKFIAKLLPSWPFSVANTAQPMTRTARSWSVGETSLWWSGKSWLWVTTRLGTALNPRDGEQKSSGHPAEWGPASL